MPAVDSGTRMQRLLKWWPLAPIVVFLAAFMFWPVGQLLSLSVTDRAGELTAQHYSRLVESTLYAKVLANTFYISFWTTLFSVGLAYPIAYYLAVVPKKTRDRLIIWILLPFWTSVLVRTFAWLVILGRHGPINNFLTDTGLVSQPLSLLFNMPSVVLGMVHAMMPLAVLTMLSVMDGIDRRLISAASTLGARPGTAFWRVYFPLSMPGVTASALLVFISSIAFFITPAFLGGRGETMIAQLVIEQVLELLNWPFAGAVSVLMLVVTLAFAGIYMRVVGTESRGPGSVRQHPVGAFGRLWQKFLLRCVEYLGRGSDMLLRVTRVGRSSGKPSHYGPLMLVIGLLLMFLVLPAFIMVPISFTAGNVIDWPPRGFSLNWYEQYWNSPVWINATVRSFVVALITGALSLAIATPAAFMLSRRRFAGRAVVMSAIMAPLIVPRVIIAVALFYLYARIGLVGTSLGLVIGHTVLALPYVVITLMAALQAYDQRFDQAASTLGAKPHQTFFLISMPLLKTAFISAFVFAFVTSFDELTIALFVTGGLTNTLPKQIWDDAFLRVTPTLAAVSTLLLVFISALILYGERLRKKSLVKG